MKRSEALFGLLRIPLDALAVAGALLLSYKLRTLNMDLIPSVQLLDTATTLPSLALYIDTFVWPSIAVFAIVSSFLGLYVLQATRSAWNEVGRILLATLLWLVAVMAWFFLVKKQLFFSRVLLIHSTVLIAFFVLLMRAIVLLVQRRLLHAGIGVRTVISVGRTVLASSARATLAHDPRYAYLGHVVDLGGLRHAEHSHAVDLVLQTDAAPESAETFALIEHCRSRQLGYAFLPPVFTDVPHLLTVERLGLLPMLRFQPTPLDGWGRILKRLFDVIISAILLVLLLPLFLFILLAILFDSGRPMFYISRRMGEKAGKQIAVIKFRSMVRDADIQKHELHAQNHRSDGPLFKVRHDPRVTRVGAILRRWSLDELPQLINVIKGQMSLVGPRPHLPEEVERYNAFQRRVFVVKPGLTGLAQIAGRSDLPFDEEVALDLQYIEEWGLLLDLWILWRTIVVVLSRKGAD